MMNDRKMLELAAKAADYTVNANMQAERDALGYGDAGLWIDGVSTCWNPRNDSKHALALAVQIGLFNTTEQFLEFQAFYSDEIRKDGVPTAATRRAILTIAAMQGMSQPPKLDRTLTAGRGVLTIWVPTGKTFELPLEICLTR